MPAAMLSTRHHGGEHRMVLVVVFVHAVAADQKQILERVDVVAHFGKSLVGAEIGRIGLGHANHRRVANVGGVDDADLLQFADRQPRSSSSSDCFQNRSVS